MGYIITYFLLFILVLLGVSFPKSKVIKWIIIAFTLSLFCLSQDSADRYIYMREYNAIGIGYITKYELMFSLTAKIGNLLKLSYDQYKAIISVVSFFMIDLYLRKNVKNVTFVWTLYMIYSSIYDAYLLRHFMGMTLILLALYRLLEEKNLKNILIYVGFVCLAGLSHSSFWFFLLLLPLSFLNNKKKITVILIFTLAVYLFGLSGLGDFIFKLYSRLPIRHYTIEKYMRKSYSNLNGILGDWIYTTICMLPAVHIWYKTRRKHRGTLKDNVQGKIAYEMITLNILFMTLLPFLYFVDNFSRLQRILIFINYIYIAKYMDTVPIKKKMIIKFGAVAYALILLSLSLVTSNTNIEVVWNSHFETNPILHFFYADN